MHQFVQMLNEMIEIIDVQYEHIIGLVAFNSMCFRIGRRVYDYRYLIIGIQMAQLAERRIEYVSAKVFIKDEDLDTVCQIRHVEADIGNVHHEHRFETLCILERE